MDDVCVHVKEIVIRVAVVEVLKPSFILTRTDRSHSDCIIHDRSVILNTEISLDAS